MFQKCFKNLIIVGFWILIPQLVLAHAGHRGFVMLLPTDLFMMGGGVVVLFTFVSMVFVTRETDIEKFSIPKIHKDEISPKLWVSSLTLFTLVLLVWIGFTGNRDPMKNLLPMAFWVFFWIGMTVVSAIFGNIWSIVSPWTVIERTFAKLKKLYIVREISLDNSRNFSYLPALILFAGFAWFELIHPSPMDPDVLAKFVLLYIFVTIVGIFFFGGNKWIERESHLQFIFVWLGGFLQFILRKL